MLFALVSSLLLYGCFVAVGALAGRFLLRGLEGPTRTHATPVLGLAVMLAALELVGAVLPIRLAVWLLVGPVVVGFVMLVRRAPAFLRARPFDAIGSVAVAFTIGLVPLAVAGRATVASLTNDDATYYITVADRLLGSRWLSTEPLPEGCLRERVLHVWNWRTGIANLMAAIEAVTHQGTPAAIGVLTTALYACLPSTAVLVSIALGAPQRARARFTVGTLSALSAAPIFLAYQHLTGQLAAFIFFPLAAVALLRVALRGGAPATLVAGFSLGAATAVFADGGAVLVLVVVAALVAARRQGRRAWSHVAIAISATGGLFPMTIWRAVKASYATIDLRLPSKRAFFPQQGWLPRSLVADATTTLGLDPWPPWPTPWPATIASVLQLAALPAALVLLVIGLMRARRRSFSLPLLVLLIVGVAFLEMRSTRYLVGKSLLMMAAFMAPIVAIGASVARRLQWGAVAVYLAGVVAAALQLMMPDRFLIIDEEHHDRLVTELSHLPVGSLLVLDGFGAPTDNVHDEHRAFRAGLLAHLQVVQPGLDGGFYKPRCADPTPFMPVPQKFFALQRTGAESLSHGVVRARFGPFTLREGDSSLRDSVVGAFAPTVGWMAAESEPSGVVFRWGAAQTQSELWLMQPTSCARLRGEVRTIERTATLDVRIQERSLYFSAIGATWTTFLTAPIVARTTHEVTMIGSGLDDLGDPSHAFAIRNLQVEPTDECLRGLRRLQRPEGEAPLPESLFARLTYAFVPAGGMRCATIVASVESNGPGRVGIQIGNDVQWSYVVANGGEVGSSPMELTNETKVTVLRDGDQSNVAMRVMALRAIPLSCPSRAP